jgi:hypothetical protein
MLSTRCRQLAETIAGEFQRNPQSHEIIVQEPAARSPKRV